MTLADQRRFDADMESRSLSERRDDELVSIRTVAWYLRVNYSTAHHLATTGKIPAVRVSERRLFVQVADLRAYVAAQRIPRDTAQASLHRFVREKRERRSA
jgi:hypothetical protein